MIKTFTQNDLIRYIYQETTVEESNEIGNALLFDERLSEDHHDLKQTVMLLDQVEKKPSKNSIDRILSYSKSFDLHFVK